MDRQSELSAAVDAAKACKSIILEAFGKKQPYKKKSCQEVVTKFDLKCEKNIRKILASKFSEYGFVGEETQPEKISEGTFWIVDPIDGSTNFVHGIPSFVVSIALIKDGKPIVGVIYDPIHEELFSAEKDGGAFLNGKQVRVSETNQIEDTVIQFNAAYNRRSEIGFLIQKIGDMIRDPQMGRSTALQTADVCCGRSDAMVKIGTSVFDIPTGILLIKEAGGKITNFRDEEYNLFEDKNIVASNGNIHKKLIEELKLE